MKRSAPLKRTAWPSAGKRQAHADPPAERGKPVAKPLTGPVRYAAPANDPVLPKPKTEPQRNRALLDMAAGQRCLLRVSGVCNHDPSTTVACHSNFAEHGKAGARKADDHWTVWGCSACHQWLDQGRAPHDQKVRVFRAAHRWMVLIWQDIDARMQPGTPRERAAAKWALELLEEKQCHPKN